VERGIYAPIEALPGADVKIGETAGHKPGDPKREGYRSVVTGLYPASLRQTSQNGLKSACAIASGAVPVRTLKPPLCQPRVFVVLCENLCENQIGVECSGGPCGTRPRSAKPRGRRRGRFVVICRVVGPAGSVRVHRRNVRAA
jgi:hypothetical protein